MLKHIIPFYLFFCVAGGISALILLFIVYRKNPRKDLLFFNLFFIAMTGNILVDLVLIYRSINITGIFELGDYLLTLTSMPLSFVMFSAFPMAIHRILDVPKEKWRNRIIITINLFSCLILYFPAGTSYDIQTGTLKIGPLFSVSGISQLLIIIYCVILILSGLKRIQNKALRSLLMQTGLLTLVFIPGFFRDITYSMGKEFFTFYPVEIISFPMYFFFLAVIIIIYSSRYFMAIIQLERTAEPSGEFLSSLGVIHGLTEREKEIIPLIVQGMGNKQIAGSLCISTKTVNNHIYNLYRKLKINSRFELLAMC